MSGIFEFQDTCYFFGWNAEEPSCFWYTDELSDDFAKSWTWFTKDQLHMLKLHLRIPNVIIITSHHHQFTDDEVLIMCLARIESGYPWFNFVPRNFGGIMDWQSQSLQRYYFKLPKTTCTSHWKGIFWCNQSYCNSTIYYSVSAWSWKFSVTLMTLLLEHLDQVKVQLVQQLVAVIPEYKTQIGFNALFMGKFFLFPLMILFVTYCVFFPFFITLQWLF